MAAVRRSLQWEYTLIALLTSGFATVLGSAIALALLEWRVKLEVEAGLWWLGIFTALLFSGLSLSLGARYLLRRLRLSPALLLRSGGA